MTLHTHTLSLMDEDKALDFVDRYLAENASLHLHTLQVSDIVNNITEATSPRTVALLHRCLDRGLLFSADKELLVRLCDKETIKKIVTLRDSGLDLRLIKKLDTQLLLVKLVSLLCLLDNHDASSTRSSTIRLIATGLLEAANKNQILLDTHHRNIINQILSSVTDRSLM